MCNNPHPARRAATIAGASALAAVLAGVLAGCGRAVTVQPPEVDPGTAAACASLAERLPDELVGQRGLAVDPDEGTTAAWGAPPILWRCGVPEPAALEPTSQLLTVNGIDWLPEPLSDGTRFTTVAGSPKTEVTVPDSYPNGATVLAELPVLTAPEAPTAPAGG